MSMNEQILNLFKDFEVGGKKIPVVFSHYERTGDTAKTEPFVVFMRESDDNALSGDDKLLEWVTYYDFDVYSTGNYIALADAVRDKLESAGWTWQPTRSSGDLYEPDTGYHHVTMSFAIERSY